MSSMKWNKILSVQFCQAAILALRDWAIEFETTNHFVYPGDKAPSEEQVDMHGFFLHCVHNEIRWHVIADYISKESARYIPRYAQERGKTVGKLSTSDARRIFLNMLLVELEEGCRVTSESQNMEAGCAYEIMLYTLKTMGEKKAMQGFAKVHKEIELWAYEIPAEVRKTIND